MKQIDINQFMAAFHAFERDNSLFDDVVDGEPWWDSIRYDVCTFLFECLSGSAYASTSFEQARRRQLGVLRRTAYRQLFHAKALTRRHRLLAIQAPRTLIEGQRRDMVLEPLTRLFHGRVLTINTLPRRYHLPDFNPARWPGRIPGHLRDLVAALIHHLHVGEHQCKRLEDIIRRRRGEFASQTAGYHRLFDRARPAAVILVQNGIEKALFHVAAMRGLPSIEAQHGVIGFGHPQYSYAADLDYSRQTTMPDLFLTFAGSWTRDVHYPAGRQAVVGTDFFAVSVPPVSAPLGTVMVCSANIYHGALLDMTRRAATALPGRSFLYKLHPNQNHETKAIQAEFADLPNVAIGAASTPATRLMEDVSHLVAVQSTVVYEALQQGRRIAIIPTLDYSIHSDIFSLPTVDVAVSADDLIAALRIPADGGDHPIFFEPFMPDKARALIAPLLADGISRGTRP